MKVAPLAEVKARLSAYVERCQTSPVVLTKNGRPAAMLVPVPEDDDELERFLLAHTPSFRRLLDLAHERIRETGGVPHGAFWAPKSKRQHPSRKRPRRKSSKTRSIRS